MTLDAATRRNLELTETIRDREEQGSLLGVLDSTVTPMGKRLIRQWVSKPLLDLASASARARTGLAFLLDNGLLRAELRAALKPLADLERLTNRILSGHAQPRDLVAMRATLRACPPSARPVRRLSGRPGRHAGATFHLCGRTGPAGSRPGRRPARHPAKPGRHPPRLFRRAG